MIDLHLHLDGSLTPEDVRTLASLSGVTLPTKNDEELFSLLTARDTRSLSEYLEKFELPLSVLQSGEAVGLAVERLGDRLFDLGYSFAEIRFAPLLHLRRGASMRSIAEGALEGVKRSRLPIGLIFCCMRGAEKAKNEETIECAAEYKNAGVVGVDLAGAEVELATAGDGRETRLKAAIDQVRDDYDFILIDSPPSLGLLSLNALAAADGVLIPIQCEFYALEGVSELMRTLDLVRDGLNPSLEVSGVLLTMFDSRTNLSGQVAGEVREYFKEKVYETVIPRTVRLSEAPSYGMPIIAYDIHAKGAEVYAELAKEVDARG